MSITVDVKRTIENKDNCLPFLVDVPVKTVIWIRPECQRKQFEVIKKARPSVIFIQSDGGRNKEEWQYICQNRKIYEEEVDWDCTIHYIYADENCGMYSMGIYCNNYVWEHVDRCIILEDDHIPSVSFFSFCKEMLEKYKDDLRINAICGNNYVGISDNCSADYLFSRNLSIWGYACWKRTMEMAHLSYKDDLYTIKSVCDLAQRYPKFQEALIGYSRGELAGGHIPGDEFYLNLNMFAQNQLFIYPKYNMISCWGATSGSAHAADSIKKMPRGIANLYFMQTYELERPIKHPIFIFPDLEFEKRQDRIMARNHPIISLYRRIVGIMKRIIGGDSIKMVKRVMGRMRRSYYEK